MSYRRIILKCLNVHWYMKLTLFLLAAGIFAAVSVAAQLPASKTIQDAVVPKITSNQWSGGFLIVSGTLTNTNTFAIRVIHLDVEGYAAADAKSYSTEDPYPFNEDLTPGQIGSFRLPIKDATKQLRFVKVTPTVEMTVAAPVVVAPPLPALQVVESTWRKGGFDTVALWTVTFRNNSDFPITDITYNTNYVAENGEVVTQGGKQAFFGKDMIRKVIPAHSDRTLEVNDGFIHSETIQASFTVVGWK
jgi:hypothetical protein